jgi:L-lactate dehydrogenase complex protein LldG
MSARDEILARIRTRQPEGRPLPALPLFPTAPGAPLDTFKAALGRMGGKWAELPAGRACDEWIAASYPDAKVVCSAAVECKGTRAIDSVMAPAELHDVDVGVVRAVFGVAETGSLWLNDTAFIWSALAFLSQHLVVLLDPSKIVPGLQDAYRAVEYFEVRYGILMTGPSATADIEGVLIHGAQGVRTLTVVPMREGG